MKYILTKEQLNALEGLSYWISDNAYIRERFGDNDPELKKVHDTITLCCFPLLDRLSVPFWVQNVVICWSENWRNTKSEYLKTFLEKKNIFVS